MDHDDALEELELAAVEPGGLDRLMAGDTVTAAAVAAHVVGCERCADEMERLRRAAPLLRDVIRTLPAEDLRERTLAYVAARGRPRAASVAPVAPAAGAGDGSVASSTPPASTASRRRSVLPWVASIAAAVLISVVASSLIIGDRVADELDAQEQAITQLSAVTSATIAVTALPDVERVPLAPTDGSMTSGTLLFSPSTTELVVVATDLAPPPDGQEYRCWVEVDGTRSPVGKMFFGGDLAYWLGDVAVLSGVTGPATFGVSLAEIGVTTPDADPVLAGDL